jgi:hypothetical protein
MVYTLGNVHRFCAFYLIQHHMDKLDMATLLLVIRWLDIPCKLGNDRYFCVVYVFLHHMGMLGMALLLLVQVLPLQ